MSSVGLALSPQGAAATAATIDVDGRPPAELWQTLATADGFQAALVDAVRELLAGSHHADRTRVLQEAGVKAADGGYATVATALDRPPEDPRHREALEATAAFGQAEPSILGYLPLEAVSEGPLALLEAASVTPTIALRVSRAFRDARAEHRRRTCELIAALAAVADVRLVATGLMARWLVREHRSDLPGGVSEQVTAGQSADVEAAVELLDPEGREVRILRQLVDEPSETLTYHALRSMHSVSRSRISQCLSRLEELGLIATFEGPTSRSVELLPSGRDFVDTVDREIGRQRSLQESVSETGQSNSQYTCTTDAHGETAQPAAGGPGGGLAESAVLPRWRTTATAGVAEAGDLVLVDREIERSGDSREYGYWYDEVDDRLQVSVEYAAAHQWWISTARALVERLDVPLPADRLDEDVLEAYPLGILRDARNLGCLSADMDGEDYLEALREERDRVIDMARRWRRGEYDDGSNFYGELLRASKGLAYTAIHLLDLAGVDVILEARIPERVRHDSEHRGHLVETLTHGTAIQATYGEFSAYRQLFEDREDRREAAMAPTVDAADPHGELVGTIVLSGPGVTALEEDLVDALEDPAPLHDEAPEFDVPISVATPSRPAYALSIRAMCQAKNLEATRAAVSLLHGLTGSPFDATRAIHALAPEATRRRIRLGEVRYALANLDADRLLPGVAPAVGKIVHALLGAEGPLTQAELAEAAAVSTRSIRRHAEVLEAFDLVEMTGDGYRVSFPARGEGKPLKPTYLTSNATLQDVTYEAALELVDDPSRLADPADRLGGAFYQPFDPGPIEDRWPGWLDVVATLVDAPLHGPPESEGHPKGPTVATFGSPIEQASLEATSTGGIS